jgi:hypothetical protein
MWIDQDSTSQKPLGVLESQNFFPFVIVYSRACSW